MSVTWTSQKAVFQGGRSSCNRPQTPPVLVGETTRGLVVVGSKWRAGAASKAGVFRPPSWWEVAWRQHLVRDSRWRWWRWSGMELGGEQGSARVNVSIASAATRGMVGAVDCWPRVARSNQTRQHEGQAMSCMLRRVRTQIWHSPLGLLRPCRPAVSPPAPSPLVKPSHFVLYPSSPPFCLSTFLQHCAPSLSLFCACALLHLVYNTSNTRALNSCCSEHHNTAVAHTIALSPTAL
jgi:hypothetical protein